MSECALPLSSHVAPDVLVVDLNHALLRGSLAQELAWRARRQRWRSLWRRSPIPLAAQSDWIMTLPYDRRVIEQVQDWRSAGGKAILITPDHLDTAQRVADTLGIFDAVCAVETGADRSALAQFPNAGRVTCLGRNGGKPVNPIQAITALRPHHWVKNLLVFLPLLASHDFDAGTWGAAMLAFAAFSFVASAVYVVNDLLDLSADRAHPRKRDRPFASGKLPLGWGPWLAGGLLCTGCSLALVLGPEFLAIMAGYVVLTTLYSLVLKRRTVVDICVLAGLYTARIIAGSVATDIPLSVWLLAFSVFFFLSMAAIKRQAELIDSAERGLLHATGRGYHVSDLPIIAMIAMSAGYVAVLVLTLYVNSPAVIVLYPAFPK
jgi:4-hydroxybenzoate polyprenyltransferase